MRLHRAIRLAQTSRRRFRTLRVVICDWGHYRLIAEAQEHAWSGEAEEQGAREVRLWIASDAPPRESYWNRAPSRVRFEDRDRIEVKNGGCWWITPPGTAAGAFTDWSLAYWHFADMSWLTRRGVRVVGEACVAGRAGVELHVERDKHSFDVLPGSDRYRYVIDAERGTLLRVESFFRGERIAVEEATEVAFDEELPDDLFEEPL
jgi:hypothetical protein